MKVYYYARRPLYATKLPEGHSELEEEDQPQVEAWLEYKRHRKTEFQKIIKYERRLTLEEAKPSGLYYLGHGGDD